MFFSVDYVIKEMVSVAAVQSQAIDTICSQLTDLKRL